MMATTISIDVTSHILDTISISCTTESRLNQTNENNVDDHEVKKWLFLVITIFSMIMGLVGNVLIIGAVFAERRLRVLSNAFIVNLAVADLIVSTFINAFALVGLFHGDAFFSSHFLLCDFVGAVCIICCACSLWSIASIAVNRYIAIRHRLSYRRIYNRGNLWLHLLIPWLAGVLLDAPNFTGWNSHAFNEEFMMCTYDIGGDLSYVAFLTFMAVGVPIVVISCSYIGIYIYAYTSSHELKKFATSPSGKSQFKKKLRRTDAKLLRSILILVLAYAIFWFPESLLVLVDRNQAVSESVYMSVAFLAHFNSSINSVIYGLTNENFRKGYKKFLFVVLKCHRVDCSFNPETTGMASEMSKGADHEHNGQDHVRSRPYIADKFVHVDPDTHCRRKGLESEPCHI